MLDLFEPATAIASVAEYLHAGGPVVVVIMITAFVMWILILERLIYFARTEQALANEKRAVWGSRPDHSSWFAHAIRERLVSEHRLSNQQFLSIIKVLVLVTPLLGLLGTVTGMIEVFEVITNAGSSNARLMASGISRATVPTMTGLAVSLTGVFLINVLERRADAKTERLADSLDIHHTEHERAAR